MIQKINLNRVGKYFLTFVFLMIIFPVMQSQNNYKKPDFAFPQQVEKGSLELLDSALKKGNDLMALRAVMNLCVARNELTDSESVKGNLILLDSASQRLHGEFRSLAYLIEAQILNKEYSWNQYVYNERILPLENPYPADPSEWSGAMFKSRILQLTDSATRNLSDYRALPISKIQPLISGYEDAERLGFSVSDFIAFNAVSALQSFATPNTVKTIPFFPAEEDKTLEGEATDKVIELLNGVIDNNLENNSIVSALAINKLSSFLPDQDRESYLEKSIQRLKGKEGIQLVIYELWQRYPEGDEKRQKDLFSLIDNALQEFPKGEGADLLKYAKNILSEKKISFNLPGVWLSNTPFDFDVSLNNVNKGYILVYKLTSSQYDAYDNLILKKFSGTGAPYKVIEINADGEIPFQARETAALEGLTPGMYVAIPSLGKTLSKGWKNRNRGVYSTFRISNISILTSNDRSEKDSGKIYVVNSTNQKPIEGASVSIYTGSSSKPKKRLTTDKDGSVSVTSEYYRIVAQYGNNVAKREAWFNYNQWTEPASRHISILTDLSIYRPGDTLEFALVGWQQDKTGNSLIKNSNVEITLRDANFTKVESIDLHLDPQGRATGKFTIPEGRLLGTYHLNAVFTDQPAISCGMAEVEVADYKLPPFEVKVEQQQEGDQSQLHFKGFAKTYSGLPIGDANVRISIDFSRWDWGWVRNHTSASFHTVATTNKEGDFTLDLPTEGLKGTIFDKGVYTLKAEVTSSTGETVSSMPLLFYLGKANTIRPSIADKIEITGNEINLHVPVYDISGLPEKVSVKYRLINIESKDSIEGSFISPAFSLNSNLIKSGRYRLEFKTEEDENWVNTETTFWRAGDNTAPYKTPLWIPKTEYVFTPQDEDISVKFGSFWEEWILCLISDETGLIEQKWIEPSAELTTLTVSLPDKNHTYFIELAGMHNLNGETGNITIIPAKRKEKLAIETLSFRDNISAGNSEKWSFKFSVNDIASPDVNAFAVMSDKALNALKDFKWNLGIWKPDVYSKVNIGIYNNRKSNSFSIFSPVLSYPSSRFEIPDWETYGFSWVSYNRYRVSGPLYYKMAATRNMKEEAEYAYDDAAPQAANLSVERESPVIMESMSEETAIETGGTAVEPGKAEELRPIEMPLAFFMPDLKSDENGILNIDFTVPDFNTTWQLQVLGYNDNLLNASIILDAVASKDVMTKSNLPKYLRTGDKAEVSALIFNNTADTIPIKGRIVVLNPGNNEVLAEQLFDEVNVDPSGNRFISLRFDVPDNLNLLAVRCYGSSGNNSDGEQGFIPVYPSSTPVVESKTFYAKTTDKSIEIKLPKFKKGANVTLKYCDNPIWEVLLALPALREDQNGSVLSIVRSLYAVLMANDIISSNKEIAQGLESILNSEDSTLSVSNLQKDENLKIVAMKATPWVNDAAAETQRLRSLKDYMSDEKVNNQIDQLKTTLKKLQNEDGGWSWFDGFKSSPYITSEVLYVLSYLSQVNLFDKDLKLMAEKGIKYYDKYLIELRKEKIELSPVSMLHYLYSRQLLTDTWSGSMKEIKNQTLEKVKKEWRYGNLSMKAISALVMLKETGYKEEAQLIMESIKEFLNRQHPLFEEAWALILFNQEDPSGETAEKLREMVYLQKETEDWGSDPYTASIIHALMVTTPDSVFHRSLPEIFANGEKILLPESQGLIGNFTVNLDAKTLSGKSLIIKRESGVPAWGGVISQYVQPIKDVKSASVDDLKVEKHVYVMTPEGKSKEVSTLKKGDKAQVVLNIDCKKEMEYVALIDQRSACLQPADQLSGIIFVDGIMTYREIKDNTTSFFIENLPPGKYVISYECSVEREGEYSLGTASVQSLYSPAQTAHSSCKLIKVNP